MLFALLLVPSCDAPAPDEQEPGAHLDPDLDGDADSDVDADELHGTLPDEALAAPEFAARNRDGTARGRPDLLGHPTVTWYYPIAGTSG